MFPHRSQRDLCLAVTLVPHAMQKRASAGNSKLQVGHFNEYSMAGAVTGTRTGFGCCGASPGLIMRGFTVGIIVAVDAAAFGFSA